MLLVGLARRDVPEQLDGDHRAEAARWVNETVGKTVTYAPRVIWVCSLPPVSDGVAGAAGGFEGL